MSACLFNGLNTNVWTGWVFFAVFIGIILLWLFTVSVVVLVVRHLSESGCTGRIRFRFSRLVLYPRIREQPLPLPLCLLLAVSTHHNLLVTATTIRL